MRLEVIADKKGAVVYVLNRPEIYLGSAETNDIVISSKEISKKHLKLIITDEKKCFVIDQGSTNGTFINDERIIPGRREEFQMLSSIRLGDQVLLTLLDKDRGDLPELPLREKFVEEKKLELPDEDKTRVISLKTLQKTKTEKIKKKRLKQLEKDLKKKKQVRKDKATLNQAIFSALLVIGFAFAAMKLWDLNKKRRARSTIVSTIKEGQWLVDDTIEMVTESSADYLIPENGLLPVAEIARYAGEADCIGTDENFLCKRMPKGSRRKNGAVTINGQLVIYLEQKEWMEHAQELVNQANESSEVTMEMLNRIIFLSFIKEHLDQGIPPEIQKKNLYFVFYEHAGSEMEIKSVNAVRGTQLPTLLSRYTENFFKVQKYDPFSIVPKLDRFYRRY